MPGPKAHKSSYEGWTSPQNVSWVVRCYMNQGPKIELDRNPEEDSIRIQKEIVDNCLEYAPKEMLIYIKPKDVLLAKNGEVTKRIEEEDVGNGQKFWFSPLPGFDKNTFPFIISSGWEMYKIINVKTGDLKPFIRTPCKYYTG